MASNSRMMMNWKGFGRRQSWPNLGALPAFFRRILRKTVKNLS
jgi:hypothetical protein